jgi:hypothetical protein
MRIGNRALAAKWTATSTVLAIRVPPSFRKVDARGKLDARGKVGARGTQAESDAAA